MSAKISQVYSREVIDSRGTPTVEVEVQLSDGASGRAMVPSGASKGQHEALELRDGDPKRYLGKGTLTAVRLINENIARILVGKSVSDPRKVDPWILELDGTAKKSKLGANAILGVSMAVAHALAASQRRPLYLAINEWMGLRPEDMKLPVPLMNVLNGGAHANNGLEIQEFMVVPHGFSSFSEALRAGCEIFQHLKTTLHDQGLSVAVGDEGGFAPELENNERALELLCEAIEKAGYKLKSQVSLALDVASSSFYDEETKTYSIRYRGNSRVTREGMISFYAELLNKFPLVSIEDPLEENDWDGWKQLTADFGKRAQIVGDDLFVTQPKWVKKGIELNVANAVLVKVNQVGSLLETFETMALCRKHGYGAIASHRSGETEDVTITHLAVGSGCGQIKTGSLSRSERTAKYNELLRIEDRAAAEGRQIPLARIFG